MNTVPFLVLVMLLGSGVLSGVTFGQQTNAAAKLQAQFEQYCTGTAVSNQPEVPQPNYQNKEVQRAAQVLSNVAPLSFYFYGGPRSAYGLFKGKTQVPDGLTFEAHAYLVQLCGEFRDRPTMIREKVRWVNRFVKLPTSAPQAIDPAKPLWPQVSAHLYRPYLALSKRLWELKKSQMQKSGTATLKLGTYEVDAAVEGTTVCETKFLFGEFAAKKRSLPNDFSAYAKEYAAYQGKCAPGDLDYYYDFRGDSNLKHYSPEANGMIWHATSVGNHCRSLTSAKEQSELEGKVTSQNCVQYFSRPFQSRYQAARSGLATWLFRDQKHDEVFSSEGQSVVIYPFRSGAAAFGPFAGKGHAAFGFNFDLGAGSELLNEYLPAWSPDPDTLAKFWKRADIGFNAVMGYQKASAGAKPTFSNVGLAYERLRDAVNRHTDWYSSAYDDLRGAQKNQAYSPFVASSYEMSASDAFTAPGYTVKSEGDGYKHWMFVFRIHKKNLYGTNHLAAGVPLVADLAWFDETSLGTNGLAKAEHAWDRLGTATEGEFETALYLHNITTGHEVKSDGMPWIDTDDSYWSGEYWK